MSKLKHSKYKNTALLFEMLVRQLTSDTLNDVSESKAGKLIQKYFRKNTELSKELELYTSLKNEKFTDNSKASQLLEAVISSRKTLNTKKLNTSKYNLVKELSNTYDINDFFKTQVTDYPILASIYKLFEYNSIDNPSEYVKQRFVIVEYVSTDNIVKTQAKHLLESEDNDTRELTYRILVKKFNEKYISLNTKQKLLIEKYITEVSNNTQLKTYINSECNALKTNLTKLNKTVDNTVIKIKINESISILTDIASKGKVAKDSEISTLLNYYELESELQNIK